MKFNSLSFEKNLQFSFPWAKVDKSLTPVTKIFSKLHHFQQRHGGYVRTKNSPGWRIQLCAPFQQRKNSSILKNDKNTDRIPYIVTPAFQFLPLIAYLHLKLIIKLFSNRNTFYYLKSAILYLQDWSVLWNKGQNVWQIYCAGLKTHLFLKKRKKRMEWVFFQMKNWCCLSWRKIVWTEVVRPFW